MPSQGNERGSNFGSRSERSQVRSRDNGYTRLFINVGTKDGLYKASFLQFILDESNMKKEVVGKIDIREMNTWVEVDSAAAGKMIKAIDGKRVNNRIVRMNEADGGYRRASDEGRKRTYGNREKRTF
jgi:ATP-dependent RNA helicase DeaD